MALNVKGRRTKGVIIGTLATLVAGVSFFYTAGMQQHIALAGAGFVFDSGSTVYNPSSTTQFVARLANGSGVNSASMDIFNSAKTTALGVGMPCRYERAKSDISCHIVSEAEASSKLSEEGEYYAQVRGTDTNGMYSEAWKRVVVDKTAPAITSTQQYVDTPTTATEFKANIDYGVSGLGSMRMIVRDQQGNEVMVGSMPCDHATATCKITQGLELLKPGAIYNVYTWARDAAGNENTVHTSTIRTAPAVPVISSAIAGGKNIANNYTNKYEVVLNWQASQGASQYQYGYWKDNDNKYTTSPTTSMSHPGTFTEGEGKYYLAVRAVSTAGVVSDWASAWVVYDKSAPVTSNIQVSPVADNGNIGGVVKVSFELSDASGVQLDRSYLAFVDGPNDKNRDKESVKYNAAFFNHEGSNRYSVEVDTKKFLKLNYVGKYNLQFTLVDMAGNRRSSKPKSMLVDNSGPIAAYTGAKGFIKGVARLSFDIVDDSGVETAQVLIKDGSFEKRYDLVAGQNNEWYVDVDTSKLKEGSYTISARPVDIFGRPRSTGVLATVVIDRTAPKILVNPGYIGDLENKIFSQVSFKLHDSNMADYYVINAHKSDFKNDEWSDANFQDIRSHLIEGSNTLTLFDIAGNSAEYVFTYDTTSPTASFSYSNKNGSAVTSENVVVTLVSTESIATPQGWVEVSDTEFTKIYAENGKYTVETVDLAGNSSTHRFEVKRIDRLAPVVSGAVHDGIYSGPVSISINEQSLANVMLNDVRMAVVTSGHTHTLTDSISEVGEYILVVTDKANNKTTVKFSIVAPIEDEVVEEINDNESSSGIFNRNNTTPPADPSGRNAPIDAASLVRRQQVALAAPVYDGTVLGVSTESEVADDANTPVVAQNSATDRSDDDKAGEVLAAQDEKTSGPWKLLADMWYLWVLALAGLAWWIIAAVRRKREDDQYFAS